MPRRARVSRKEVQLDPKFNNPSLAKFINKLMFSGHKTVAMKVIYDAFDIIEQQTKKSPIEIFDQAFKNATPLLEVKPRRVGGATYQVPVEVKQDRGLALATRWILTAARARSGKSMAAKLAGELMDAAQGQGTTIKKKADTHKMAEANRAFVHFRW